MNASVPYRFATRRRKLTLPRRPFCRGSRKQYTSDANIVVLMVVLYMKDLPSTVRTSGAPTGGCRGDTLGVSFLWLSRSCIDVHTLTGLEPTRDTMEVERVLMVSLNPKSSWRTHVTDSPRNGAPLRLAALVRLALNACVSAEATTCDQAWLCVESVCTVNKTATRVGEAVRKCRRFHQHIKPKGDAERGKRTASRQAFTHRGP